MANNFSNGVKTRVMLDIAPAEIHKHAAVIVECWKHKDRGRVKRAWLTTFDETERAKAAALYKRLYVWEIRTGYPQAVSLNPVEYVLLQNLASFFATEVR